MSDWEIVGTQIAIQFVLLIVYLVWSNSRKSGFEIDVSYYLFLIVIFTTMGMSLVFQGMN